jgi:tRNA uridine 5-carboxymethylaminomethyl modification enzyme
MFTSRAEYRILLRQDNADLRLSEKAFHLGLLSAAQWKKVQRKQEQTELLKKTLRLQGITPNEINPALSQIDSSPISQQVKLSSVLTRPGTTLNMLKECSSTLSNFLKDNNIEKDVEVQAEIQIKYEGYISREEEMAEKMQRLEKVVIPQDIDFNQLKSLSSEAIEKLNQIKPSSIGQASRISGVSPSDISVLLIYLGR